MGDPKPDDCVDVDADLDPDNVTADDFELVQVVLRNCVHGMWDDRPDLAQAGILALWRAKRRYKPGKGSWKTYASIRIRGAIIDELRRIVPGMRSSQVPRMHSIEEVGIGAEVDSKYEGDCDPHEKLEDAMRRKYERTALDLALRNLTPDQRRLIEELHGKDDPKRQYELAAEMGVNTSTLSRRYLAALKSMRDTISSLAKKTH